MHTVNNPLGWTRNERTMLVLLAAIQVLLGSVALLAAHEADHTWSTLLFLSQPLVLFGLSGPILVLLGSRWLGTIMAGFHAACTIVVTSAIQGFATEGGPFVRGIVYGGELLAMLLLLGMVSFTRRD